MALQNRKVNVTPINKNLVKLGFSNTTSGVHISRTMMLAELSLLFDFLPEETDSKEAYFAAIVNENCLSKRSAKTRLLTARHLAELYSLDNTFLLFRALKFFWYRVESARPQLALLIAYARDPILRLSAKHILLASPGVQIQRQDIENIVSSAFPDRFSEATLKSTSQNINATWTQAGYLTGKVKKVRCVTQTNEAAVSLAFLMAYLRGIRGEELLSSEYIQLLDCRPDKALDFIESAARKGWLVFKRVGSVVEVAFPSLINNQEMEWAREQA